MLVFQSRHNMFKKWRLKNQNDTKNFIQSLELQSRLLHMIVVNIK
jgi:hypothetical protein